ncbi:PAXNEB protein domain-containing protein [Ditylenchus destructor]|uniref:Elongator complex protein 4 n=1 Tax=Ditylenchus destructor TaxID=166010 RepID=A0AAD4RDV2_9BILA|nr:PAXNEB protein domain-containing protein [Ditylenchus destructor]
MALGYYTAELSEIVSCQRRDDEHIAHLIEQFSSIFKSLFGDLQWIRFYSHFPNIGRVLYYSCTTLLGRQTLGEEYLALIQVADQKQLTPVSLFRRILFVILESYGDVIFRKFIQKLHELKSNLNERHGLLIWIPLYLLDNASNLHKSIFFALHSKFYTVPRRLSSISYVSLRPQTNTISRLFFFMAISVIVQCILVITFKLIEAKRISIRENMHNQLSSGKTNKKISTNNAMAVPQNSRVCSICLMNKSPICTPCGHTFCWDCIVEYAETSTGTEALDYALGDGVPNTSIIVVDELGTRKFAKPLLRCFIAEGVEEGHEIFLASPSRSESNELLENIPIRSSSDSTSKPTPSYSQNGGGEHNFRIAWRYNTVADVNSSIGFSQGQPKFDLSKNMSLDSTNKSGLLHIYSNFITPTYDDLWQQLKPYLKKPEFSTVQCASGDKNNLLRIVIHDFSSPLWSSDNGCMLSFLTHLKAFTRQLNCVVIFSIDSTLLPHEVTSRIIRLADAVFRLEYLSESTQKAMSLYQKFDGRFYIVKLPSIPSAGPSNRPDCLDLVFSLKRRSFEVSILHLPPAIGEEEVKKMPATSCRTLQNEF